MHARTIITVPGNMKKNAKKGYRSMHVGQEARPWQDSALQACVVFLILLGIYAVKKVTMYHNQARIAQKYVH